VSFSLQGTIRIHIGTLVHGDLSPTVIVVNVVSCQCGYYVLLFCEVKATVIVLCNYSGSAHHSVPNAVRTIYR